MPETDQQLWRRVQGLKERRIKMDDDTRQAWNKLKRKLNREWQEDQSGFKFGTPEFRAWLAAEKARERREFMDWFVEFERKKWERGKATTTSRLGKMLRMTVANGCTEGEATNAAELIGVLTKKPMTQWFK
jgi:hypothetical protein